MNRLAIALLLAGCDPSSFVSAPSQVDGGAIPASSVVPRPGSDEPGPIVSASPPLRDGAGSETAPPPEPMAVGDQLAIDPPLPKAELSGVLVEARWVWPKPPANAPEASEEGLGRARKKIALDHAVSIASDGRMRLAFRSPALPFPAGSELLARSDRFGSLLVWPDSPQYRIVVPGALRAAFEDRRLDVVPLSKATAAELGEGKRLGVAVRKVELKSSYGSVAFELARIHEAGAGGVLLCRFLVELGGIDPATPLCRAEPEPEVPLVASYAWGAGPERKESARFEVVSFHPREKDASHIPVPPLGAASRGDGVPGPASVSFLGDDELAAFHGKDGAVVPQPGAPKSGLVAVNAGERTVYLLIDGIPIGYTAPGGALKLESLRPGRYRAQWRTLLGEELTPVTDVDVPVMIRYPTRPAGAEDDKGGG